MIPRTLIAEVKVPGDPVGKGRLRLTARMTDESGRRTRARVHTSAHARVGDFCGVGVRGADLARRASNATQVRGGTPSLLLQP